MLAGLLTVVLVLVLAGSLSWQAGIDPFEVATQALGAFRNHLTESVTARPLAAAATYFGFYVLVTALSLPAAALLTLAGGAAFGTLQATVLVSFASTLGATLAMLASRFLLRDHVRRLAGPRLTTVEHRLTQDGAFYLFSLRLVPAVPFALVNLLAGLAPMRVRTYWWVSQLAMLPATFVYANAGHELGAVSSAAGLLSPTLILAFLLLAALPWIARATLAAGQRRRAHRR